MQHFLRHDPCASHLLARPAALHWLFPSTTLDTPPALPPQPTPALLENSYVAAFVTPLPQPPPQPGPQGSRSLVKGTPLKRKVESLRCFHAIVDGVALGTVYEPPAAVAEVKEPVAVSRRIALFLDDDGPMRNILVTELPGGIVVVNSHMATPVRHPTGVVDIELRSELLTFQIGGFGGDGGESKSEPRMIMRKSFVGGRMCPFCEMVDEGVCECAPAFRASLLPQMSRREPTLQGFLETQESLLSAAFMGEAVVETPGVGTRVFSGQMISASFTCETGTLLRIAKLEFANWSERQVVKPLFAGIRGVRVHGEKDDDDDVAARFQEKNANDPFAVQSLLGARGNVIISEGKTFSGTTKECSKEGSSSKYPVIAAPLNSMSVRPSEVPPRKRFKRESCVLDNAAENSASFEEMRKKTRYHPPISSRGLGSSGWGPTQQEANAASFLGVRKQTQVQSSSIDEMDGWAHPPISSRGMGSSGWAPTQQEANAASFLQVREQTQVQSSSADEMDGRACNMALAPQHDPCQASRTGFNAATAQIIKPTPQIFSSTHAFYSDQKGKMAQEAPSHVHPNGKLPEAPPIWNNFPSADPSKPGPSVSAHICPLCSKQLNRAADVRRHMRAVHQDERPFVCDSCGKSFKLAHHLKNHTQDVHEALKPFTCDLCEHRFSRKHDLILHTKKKHL